uniref:Ubiquitin-like protease family profile domain-containing protein n=1 Tax=Ditylenchus dipsaci TaxID=166011 RepID=A0A915EKD8_9BILA
MSQPCDQGIIQNLKVHYRRFLLVERIKVIDDKKDILINLLSALHNLRRAWTEVKPQTIANCFRHAKFVINQEVEETVADEADGMDELLNAWGNLQLLGGINKEAAMMDYMDVDADVITVIAKANQVCKVNKKQTEKSKGQDIQVVILDCNVQRGYEALDPTNWLAMNKKNIPMQAKTNGNDCGVFVCQYAECVTQGREIDFSQETMDNLREKMSIEIRRGELT